MVEQKKYINHPMRVKVVGNDFVAVAKDEALFVIKELVSRIAPVAIVEERLAFDCLVAIDIEPKKLRELAKNSLNLVVVASQQRKPDSLNTYLRECRHFTRGIDSCKVIIVGKIGESWELNDRWWPLIRTLFNLSVNYDY